MFVRMKASHMQILSTNRACMINYIKFCLVDPINKNIPSGPDRDEVLFQKAQAPQNVPLPRPYRTTEE